jgi:hypothetical protein
MQENYRICLTTMDLTKILEMVGSFIGGATLSAAITFRITKNRYVNRNNTTVTQTGNKAGRDIIGGDKSGH